MLKATACTTKLFLLLIISAPSNSKILVLFSQSSEELGMQSAYKFKNHDYSTKISE